jgi:RNA polymerase sigma factor (sigma-70 family)
MPLPEASFANYLFTIAHNLDVDRRRKRHPETFAANAPPAILDRAQPVPDAVLRRLAIYACLEKLTDQEQHVIENWEHALGTKSLTEMANDLGVSVARVHAIKESALTKLRACLEGKGFGG